MQSLFSGQNSEFSITEEVPDDDVELASYDKVTVSRTCEARGSSGTVSRALFTSLAGDTHCMIKRRQVWGGMRDAWTDLPLCSFYCTPKPCSMSFDNKP